MEQLTITPDFLLIDAMQLDVMIEQKSLIKGDARSVSIAAASILAKTRSRRPMKNGIADYPQYGLARTKVMARRIIWQALAGAWPLAAASLFVCPGAGSGLLGCGGGARGAAAGNLAQRVVKTPSVFLHLKFPRYGDDCLCTCVGGFVDAPIGGS